jgi:hypothetical protein
MKSSTSARTFSLSIVSLTYHHHFQTDLAPNVHITAESSSRQPSPSSSTSTSSCKDNGTDGNGKSEGHIQDEDEPDMDAYELMTMDEIINGKVIFVTLHICLFVAF